MRHTGSALDDPEKSLLQRRSVFSGGFDLQSVCAVVGSDGIDEYTILGLLDALVRKSLLIADRSSERTRLSLLETIRQFAKEQLVANGTRTAHARHFAGAKPTYWPCGTAPDNARPMPGSPRRRRICAPPSGGPPTTAILT